MSNIILHIEINAIGITLLLLMLFNFGGEAVRKHAYDQRIFRLLLITNILIFVFDAVSWSVNGVDTMSARIINQMANALYYSLQTVECLLWLLFSDFRIFSDMSRLRRRLFLYSLPALLFVSLNFINVFTGWIYYFNDKNEYLRGPYFILSTIFCAYYFLFAIVITFKGTKNRKYLERRNLRKFLLIFPIPSFIGAVLQASFFGVSLIWICTTLSLLIIYVNVQNQQVITDSLTGLNNRGRFENYFNEKLETVTAGKELYLIILDIDNFKRINDLYGHMEGDYALISVADILRSCVGENDFLGRLAGDEFVIVGERASVEMVSELTGLIDAKISVFNQKKTLKYSITLSYGVAYYRTDASSVEGLVRVADTRMYEAKNKKKQVIGSFMST